MKSRSVELSPHYKGLDVVISVYEQVEIIFVEGIKVYADHFRLLIFENA